MIDNFTYDEYRAVLELAYKHNVITSFNRYREGYKDNQLILRHDIDFSVEMAYEVAKINYEMNVDATFFFMITNSHYNCLDKKNRTLIKCIANMGFEVGLHFDPTLYADCDFAKHAKFESNIIESITGVRVESISLHNPSIHGQMFNIIGYNNAYDAKWFSDEVYLSDSRKMFRNKNIKDFLTDKTKSVKQVLFHPIHYNTTALTYTETFAELVVKEIETFDEELLIANENYFDQAKNKRIISILKDRKV